jgi:hypothetical protein
MKQHLENIGVRVAVVRRLLVGGVSLLLVALFAAMDGTGTIASVSTSVRQAHVLAIWYVRSGQWRTDAKACVTQAEYVFCLTSGAGARLDFDPDE